MPVAEWRDRWMRVLVITWAIVGIMLLLAVSGWVLGKVSTALVPFLLALVLVYVFKGPVAVLERRGIHRGVAVGICYLVGLAVVGGALAFIIPPLAEQVRQFVAAFPGYYERANTMVLDLQTTYRAIVVPEWVKGALDNLEQTLKERSAEWSAILAREAFSAGGTAINVLANTVLSLVIGFWMLKDLPAIGREAVLLAGPSRKDEATIVLGKVSTVLGGYLRGQLILSAATVLIVVTGLTLFGVPYSLVIGLLAGAFNVIPWIGPALSAVIAGVSAAFVSPWLVVAAVGVVVGAQQLTEIFVQPRVMSEQVDLHPLLVIFSLLAGAAAFGFVGILLAIPVAAIAKGLFVHYFEKHTRSTLTTAEGALFRTPGRRTPDTDDQPCAVPAQEPADEHEGAASAEEESRS